MPHTEVPAPSMASNTMRNKDARLWTKKAHRAVCIFEEDYLHYTGARGLLTQYKGHEELGHKMLHFPEKDLLLTAIRASTDATLKIVILVLLGVYATTKGIFNERGISDLGRLVYHISLPALVFSNILTEVSVERLLVLWKLPAVAVVHVSSGYLLAKVMIRFLGLKGIEAGAVTLALMFGNVGSLTIAIIGTLCGDDPLASQVGPKCAVKGVEYISFYLIAQNILVFTWAEKIVKDNYSHAEEALEDEPVVGADMESVPPPSSLLSSQGPSISLPPPVLVEHSYSEGVRRPLNITTKPLSTSSSCVNMASPGSEGGMSTTPSGQHLRMRRHHSSAAIIDQHTLHSIMSRYPIDAAVSHPAAEDEEGALLSTTPRQRADSWVRRASFTSHVDSPRSRSSSLSNSIHNPSHAPQPSLDPVHPQGGAATETDMLLRNSSPRAPAYIYWLGSAYVCVCEGLLGLLVLLQRMGSNPTIRAALLAFLLGIFPPIKALFVGGRDPPLGCVLQAIQILGTAQVPCSMLMLSGSGTIRYLNSAPHLKSAESPGKGFTFSPNAVLAIILGRIVIFPLIGLLLWWGLLEAKLLEGVPILSLVILLDAAVPTAQNIVMLVLVHGTPEHGQALAYVILWQYAMSVPFLIMYVAVFLALINDIYF